jgi:hypothetical protein
MEIAGNENELAQQLSKAGFRPELAEIARGDYNAVSKGSSMETLVNVNGERFWADIHFDFYLGGRIEVSGVHAALLPRQQWLEFKGLPDAREIYQQLLQQQIPHGIYEGINTRELENRMQAVDWHHHPGHFKYNEDNPSDKPLAEMRGIEKQLDRLCRIEGNERAAVVWEHLLVKYFKGTPPEAAICETVPYLTQSFKNSNYLNNNTMNEDNFNYLKDNLKYLGFEDKLNGPLSEKMAAQVPEFKLDTHIPHYHNAVDYTIHFKKSESSDRYFLNRYDAKLSNGKPEEDRAQTFYINKGHGVTAKEAFNLLEGRSVYKTLENKEQQKYNVWLQLDFENKDKHNNHKINTFYDKYNYKIERALDKYQIQELNAPGAKADLIRSLQKGNTQQVTATIDGKEVKAYVEALPEKRSINIYNEKMKLQDTAAYLKARAGNDLAKEKAKREEQKQAEGQTQGKKKSRGPSH